MAKVKVGINGFGRIGRNVLRSWLEDEGNIEIIAVNDIADNKTLAHLLKYDSVHGVLEGKIEAVEGGISVNGHTIKVIAEKDPAKLPWKDMGIPIVLESTGLFTDVTKAATHQTAGAKKIIISAPAKGDCKTIVLGVNEKTYDPDKDHIISNASCTTNALAPMSKVLVDNFGIKRGLMTTIHAYTNDQKILDLPHKDLRRARAAAMSMIPTSTGAAKAIGLVIPELKGKMHGLAIRVPTPDGSIVDLTFETEKKTDAASINAAMKKAAEGPMKGILQYSEDELVSIDIVGNPHSSIFDSKLTIQLDDTMFKAFAWYDNEWGYSCRTVDLMKLLASKI
jgi:glyceraldehyde 3-phosphate dehydrogenase